MFELAVNNGLIIDGTGEPGYIGSIGISNGKIAQISSDPLPGKNIIDASGLVVAPGFVDVHSHYDFVPFIDNQLTEKIGQGITTMLVGLCGLSAQPVLPDKIPLIDKYVGFNRSGAEVDYSWGSTKGYLDVLDQQGLGINVAVLVGHGTLRIDAMGFDNRDPEADELEHMKRLLGNSMQEGAYGMSLGLIYPPGVYSKQEEFIELAGVIKEYNGVLATHMRSESDQLLESMEQSIDIAKKTGVSLQIHHLKAIGSQNWGKGKAAIEMIEAANKEGLCVHADQYHYTYGCGPLRSLLPPWSHEGGVEKLIERLADTELCRRITEQVQTDRSYENLYLYSGGDGNGVTILYSPETPQLVGKSLWQIGREMEITPIEALFYVVRHNGGKEKAAIQIASEDDLEEILQSDYVMIGSDANRPAPGAMCHPRTYGEFARVYRRYVREKAVITLETAVHKMTGLPCSKYGFSNKGMIKTGYDADITIFDYNTIKDNADMTDTTAMPQGIHFVVIAGVMAMNNGQYTHSLSGRTLRKE